MYDIISDLENCHYVNNLRREQLKVERAQVASSSPTYDILTAKIAVYATVNKALSEILDKARSSVSLVS